MRILTEDIIKSEGHKVELMGWVAGRRDHGKIIFIDLRDRSGIAQIVFTPKEAVYAEAEKLRPEWVVKISGEVRRRPKGSENPDIVTGEFEVGAQVLEVLNESETPPFSIDGDGYELDESLRLKYRYVDLRRPRLSRNLKIRNEIAQFIRSYLTEKSFLEVDTPLLTKSTPEGSRDFIVPSRLQPGKFYALPQSPQQYKQLLMASGVERYFQLAHNFRDEDLRADRAFEHTQIDLEMSFVEQRDVMNLMEGLMTALFESFGKKIIQKPFPVFDYAQAMKKFGADKFDLRTSGDPNEMAFAWVINFPVFEKDSKTGELTYAHNPFTAPHPEDIPNLMAGKELEKMTSLQYDLVCNGYELGSGGIRINKAELLEKVFELLGHSKENIQSEFGHILEAFKFGTPPHGGMGLGFDRIMMLLTDEKYIREVIPFPMTSGGRTSIMEAPSEVAKEQLDELGLTLKEKKQ